MRKFIPTNYRACPGFSRAPRHAMRSSLTTSITHSPLMWAEPAYFGTSRYVVRGEMAPCSPSPSDSNQPDAVVIPLASQTGRTTSTLHASVRVRSNVLAPRSRKSMLPPDRSITDLPANVFLARARSLRNDRSRKRHLFTPCRSPHNRSYVRAGLRLFEASP